LAIAVTIQQAARSLIVTVVPQTMQSVSEQAQGLLELLVRGDVYTGTDLQSQ